MCLYGYRLRKATGNMAQTNFLSPINFVFKLAIIPNTEYNIQKASIPGMELGIAYSPSPFVKLVNPGNIEYGELDLTFKVGQDMSDYMEIFNWMVSLGHPDSLSQYKNIKSDATLVILDPARNPKINISFTDCFPVRISPIQMDTTLEAVEYLSASVSFKFQRFYYNVLSTGQ